MINITRVYTSSLYQSVIGLDDYNVSNVVSITIFANNSKANKNKIQYITILPHTRAKKSKITKRKGGSQLIHMI